MGGNYSAIQPETGGLIKAWNHGVEFDDGTMGQLRNLAGMPFIHKHVAAMPDAHWGMDFAWENRKAMMEATLGAMRKHLPPFSVTEVAVNCHHNYVAKENHLVVGQFDCGNDA